MGAEEIIKAATDSSFASKPAERLSVTTPDISLNGFVYWFA